MAELSPAAQAVLLAARYEPKAEYIGTLEFRIAAALRAVADQAVPSCSTRSDRGVQRMLIRRTILSIADELENTNA